MYKCSQYRNEQMRFVGARVGGHLTQLAWPISKVQLGVCAQDIGPHSMATSPHIVQPVVTNIDGLQQQLKILSLMEVKGPSTFTGFSASVFKRQQHWQQLHPHSMPSHSTRCRVKRQAHKPRGTAVTRQQKHSFSQVTQFCPKVQ